MEKKSWIVVDDSRDIQIKELSITKNDVPGAKGDFSVKVRKLRGGLRHGVQVIEIDNGACRFSLLPTRGMGIWQAWLGEKRFSWTSPVKGPIHPTFVPLMEPSGLGWLDGFDEFLVRCGLTSNGAPDFDEKGNLVYPLHGRVANLPARSVEISIEDDEITVTGIVDETRFHFQNLRLTAEFKTKIGEPGFRLHDRVTNLAGRAAEMQMLYHTNFGTDLLDAGSKIVAPVKTLVPRNDHAAASVAAWDHYSAPQSGFEEQVYFFELAADKDGNTQSLLKNAHANLGASLHFNKKQLPCFTIWKDTMATEDGYVTGFEPGTNFPNPRTYETEHNRIVPIAPGKSVAMDLRVELHDNAKGVERAEQAVAKLQAGTTPRIFDSPQKGWCAP